ncbi:hypothetical protein KBE88_02705 [Candidatus Saccharibacteria bacterium]|nr:hypothetical protein [Candidatus Saccharibacteria bacterium]
MFKDILKILLKVLLVIAFIWLGWKLLQPSESDQSIEIDESNIMYI